MYFKVIDTKSHTDTHSNMSYIFKNASFSSDSLILICISLLSLASSRDIITTKSHFKYDLYMSIKVSMSDECSKCTWFHTIDR